MFFGAGLGPNMVGSGDDCFDEGLHINRGGEEAAEIAVALLVVRVEREIVDLVVRMLEDRGFPSPKVGMLECELPHATSSRDGSIMRMAARFRRRGVRTRRRSCAPSAMDRPSRFPNTKA